MKNFKTLFIILVSIIIIVSCAFFKSFKEGLTNNDNKYNFVLIGDSVLNNSNYVPSGKSVVDNLKTKTTKVFDFAKDGATINDSYSQLDKIPLDLNKINVLNLYLPANPRYQSYKTSIDQWNQLIKEYSSKIGEMYNVIDLATLLTSPEDFIYDIEPSETASQKIANAIYLTR